MRRVPCVRTAFWLFVLGVRPCLAQCPPGWLPGGGYPGVQGAFLTAFEPWDPDGPGQRRPQLAFAGNFGLAGDRRAAGLASWDPVSRRVTPLCSAYTGTITRMAGLPDGRLVVAGPLFEIDGVAVNNIAAWDGSSWSPLGEGLGTPGLQLTSMLVLPGGDLVVSGPFTSAGGREASRIARWDGARWSPLGAGLSDPASAMAILPSGVVLVGGPFSRAGGRQARLVATWDGREWSAPDPGPFGDQLRSVMGVAAGPGGAMIVAGLFEPRSGPAACRVQRLEAGWRPMGGAFSGTIEELCTLEDGRLAAAGPFTAVGADPIARYAVWDGQAWGSPDSPPPGGAGRREVDGRTVVATGASPDGRTAAEGLALWETGAWAPIMPGLGQPHPPDVFETSGLFRLAAAADGALFGSGVVAAGGAAVGSRVLRWDGARWASLGGGPERGWACLAVMPDGGVVAGGAFESLGTTPVRRLAAWDGDAWRELGGGVAGAAASVNVLRVLADGRLLVGGVFSSAGSRQARGVAVWDGEDWTPFGDGVDGAVHACAVAPNGDLIAAGAFVAAGGHPARSIARWDGAVWSPLGAGLEGEVYAVEFLPGGDLVAAGRFAWSGGPPVRLNSIARWRDGAWSSLGGGVGGPRPASLTVHALAILPGGDLVAGGAFETAGGVRAPRIARWDGASWSPLAAEFLDDGSSQLAEVRALAMMSEGELAVGGTFLGVDGVVTPYFARWSPQPRFRIVDHPAPVVAACGGDTEFTVRPAVGFRGVAALWRRDGVPIDAGDPRVRIETSDFSSTLTIRGVRAFDAGAYDCVLSAGCGWQASRPALLSLDPAMCSRIDFNGDGAVDLADLDAYVGCFDGGECPAGRSPEFTCDDFLDFFDYADFLVAFEAGC